MKNVQNIQTIRVRVQKSNFKAGVSFCKSHQGSYDASTQTWTVRFDVDCIEFLSRNGVDLVPEVSPIDRMMSEVE